MVDEGGGGWEQGRAVTGRRRSWTKGRVAGWGEFKFQVMLSRSIPQGRQQGAAAVSQM